MAVTDHDTTAAIPEVQRLAAPRGIEAVAGIEITAIDFGPLPAKDWAVDGTRSGTGGSVSVTSLGTAKPGQRNYGQEGKAQYIATKMPFMEREARAEVGMVDDAETIVVSFGSLRGKRMRPSSDRQAPAMIARPSTSRAFARSEPRIDVCATTISPARSAKITMKSSGRLPSVDCSTPVAAAPNSAPTASVPIPTVQASSASATMPTTNWTTASAS